WSDEASGPAAGRVRVTRWLALPAATALALTTLTVAGAAPASADTPTDQCTFGGKPYKGRPWSLQRVQLDQLWRQTKGRGVKVAVIDTGVDIKNPQLKGVVDAGEGQNFLPPKSELKKN